MPLKFPESKFPTPDATFWNFEAGLDDPSIRSWQWNDFLNYEYARESRLIQESVKEIRELRKPRTGSQEADQSPRKQFPPYAVYLVNSHGNYFPDTPWMKLPNELRVIRMKLAGGGQIRKDFEEDIFRVLDIVQLQDDLCRDEIIFRDRTLIKELTAVIQIDLSQSDERIQQQFADWLEWRRKKISRDYDPNDDDAIKKIDAKYGTSREKTFRMRMLKAMTFNHKPGPKPGKGNDKNFRCLFRYLSAKRLIDYYQTKGEPWFEVCVYLTEKVLGKPLYSQHDKSTWIRAQNDAAKTLKQFEKLWSGYVFGPCYIWDYNKLNKLGSGFMTRDGYGESPSSK